MAMLLLDEYSIWEIFKHLDLDSRRYLSVTCKKFHQINKTVLNWNILEDDLKCQLVDCISNGHNRDDIPFNFKYQYTVSMVLKYFLQTIDICQKILKDSLDAGTMQSCKIGALGLILRYSMSCEDLGFSHLVKIGNSSHIDLNCWYTFTPSPGKFIYLCNCKNPDQKLRRLPFMDDVVIGITYNETTDQTNFYMCNISRFDWFYTKPTDSVEFSKDASILQKICKTLSQSFKLSKKTSEKLTSEKLYQMAKLSMASQADCIFATLLHDIKRIKSRFHNELEKLNFTQPDLLKLVNKLKTFADLSNFQRRDILESLIDFVQPIGNTINVFDYGELLAYVPVVKKILARSSCVKDSEMKCELIVIRLEQDVVLKSKITFTSSSQYTLELNRKKLLQILDGAHDIILSEEHMNEITTVFETFVEKNIDKTLLASVPEISLDFVFQLLRCIHSAKVSLLDEIRFHVH